MPFLPPLKPPSEPPTGAQAAGSLFYGENLLSRASFLTAAQSSAPPPPAPPPSAPPPSTERKLPGWMTGERDPAEAKPSKPSQPRVPNQPSKPRQPSQPNHPIQPPRPIQKPRQQSPEDDSWPTAAPKAPKPLHNVTAAISGIVNPERGEIRTKLIDLGGSYQGNWTKACTHLICVKRGTPKFNQAHGHSTIVSPLWIEACASVGSRVEEGPYIIHSDDSSDDEVLVVAPPQKRARNESEIACASCTFLNGTDAKFCSNCGSQLAPPPPPTWACKCGKENDAVGNFCVACGTRRGEAANPYSVEACLKGVVVYIYGVFDDQVRDHLQRIVKSNGGTETPFLGSHSTHVVTNRPWGDEFRKALAEDPHLVIVKESWLYDVEKLGVKPAAREHRL